MLFIENYDAKSLDRSSVSMIDKYNGRLNLVGMLLTRLSTLIDNLLSLIRDVRTTLGQCKQRVYDNLNQVKEVIDGNDITGTEGTIAAIEDALKAGDEAIARAEATLEGVQQEMECDESVLEVVNDCGEACNEIPTTDEVEDCTFCNYEIATIGEGGTTTNGCAVCDHGECKVDVECSEAKPSGANVYDCSYGTSFDTTCGQFYTYDVDCKETYCNLQETPTVENCTFTCNHSSPCQEMSMPENCTYTCTDGSGCAYGGDDCSYGTVCGQGESCNQTECSQYDCGEPCGETCHMTNDEGDCSEGDCSEGSCGECSESDDGPCNQYDCSEYDCGEPCGESCGLL